VQPRPEDYDYDLDHALAAVVGLRTIVPSDAFSADTLGTERSGSGVVIGKDGLILTIGYLVVEAETVWITLGDGRAVPGHALAYDHETGFGLVQALTHMSFPWLPLGSSHDVRVGDDVVIAGTGGRRHAVATRIVAKQEFAGYWEYVLDEALFTAPAHPNWGGTALIGPMGDLIGIGSLQLQHTRADGGTEDLNMVVPIDLLKPILKSLRTTGRAGRPPRPWLGFYATELEDKLVVAGLSSRGPARTGDLRGGDIVMTVAGEEVTSLADMFRKIWALGPAGVEVPLQVYRDGKTRDLRIKSADRNRFLRAPTMH
jgi:S1-C subfamily serine protease